VPPVRLAVGLATGVATVANVSTGSRVGHPDQDMRFKFLLLGCLLTASSGAPYTVTYTYQGGIGATQLTGTPNYNARIRVLSNPGNGCASDRLRQFDASAFAGPLPGSLGLESGLNYMHGCAGSIVDLALARRIRLGGTRALQFRVEAFNLFNTVVFTGRNANMQLAGLDSAGTATNLPFDAAGNPIPSRVLPQGAGFGVATAAQPLRSVQMQLRLQF